MGRSEGRAKFAVVLAALAAAVGACGPAASPGNGHADIAPGVRARVDRARLLGRAIYEQDQASAAATDAVLATTPKGDPRVHGWITTGHDGVYTTEFVTHPDTTPAAVYEAHLQRGRAPRVQALDPPRPLQGDTLHMFRAERTALHARIPQCASQYNPVVFPASRLGALSQAMRGQRGWVVYLLAATGSRDIIIVGGHVRVLVSADGKRVISSTQMEPHCMLVRRVPKMVMLYATTHARLPQETQFYTSAEYALPFGVITKNGYVWTLTPSQFDVDKVK